MMAWMISPEGAMLMERGLQPEDFIGYITLMLDDTDPRSAAQQLNDNYQHGGGWRPMDGFTRASPDRLALAYPGDPVLLPLAAAFMRDELVVVYPHEIFAVFQKDGTFEASRMD